MRKIKRERERERERERAPAGSVFWEPVEYVGQHSASSAFLPTCLSKWIRANLLNKLHY